MNQYNNENNHGNYEKNNNENSNNEKSNNENSNNENCNNENSNNENRNNENYNNSKESNTNSENSKAEDKRTAEEHRDERVKETGQVTLDKNQKKHHIHLLTIIGEIEGHDVLSANAKTTKYEHILPELAAIEDSEDIKGVLVLLNTMGGDVEAGLAIAEMIASLSKPTVSLVLGGSHSIGVPLAVSTKYSFIVETGTMLVHPVRVNGMTIGAPQTYEYFQRIQDRITGFISAHSRVSKERLEKMMLERGQLTKDLGTILVGQDAINEGIIDEIGGIKEALGKLYEFIENKDEF